MRAEIMASGAAGTPTRITPQAFWCLTSTPSSAFMCLFLSVVVLVWVSMHTEAM